MTLDGYIYKVVVIIIYSLSLSDHKIKRNGKQRLPPPRKKKLHKDKEQSYGKSHCFALCTATSYTFYINATHITAVCFLFSRFFVPVSTHLLHTRTTFGDFFFVAALINFY